MISLRIQPPVIRARFYVRKVKTVCPRVSHVSHVVAGANERRLYSQATYDLSFRKRTSTVMAWLN